MKTNNIMTRSEFQRIQRTKDGYFNAKSMLDNFLMNNRSKKTMASYKKQKSVKEYIQYLKDEEGIEAPLIAGRGRDAATWMHPLLMIDFAMYLSLEFKTTVLKWALDGLIKSRHNAGDYYIEMCSAITNVYVDYYKKKPPPMIFVNEARLISSLVSTKDRNSMIENELKQITYLQKVNTNLIKKRIGKESRIKKLKEAAEIQIWEDK